MNQQDKENIIANLISTPAGRIKLSMAMARPLFKGICPICSIKYMNLQDHCNSVGDDLHIVLSVQDA